MKTPAAMAVCMAETIPEGARITQARQFRRRGKAG